MVMRMDEDVSMMVLILVVRRRMVVTVVMMVEEGATAVLMLGVLRRVVVAVVREGVVMVVVERTTLFPSYHQKPVPFVLLRRVIFALVRAHGMWTCPYSPHEQEAVADREGVVSFDTLDMSG